MNCKSVACQCPFFGDGCFSITAPPCGRDCVSIVVKFCANFHPDFDSLINCAITLLNFRVLQVVDRDAPLQVLIPQTLLVSLMQITI